ncbi:permease prefix domain 1-containing protein [Geomicrobium sp. JCM 19038]|uniref:permease prefix domain 1-containing protein n=1 Tax=Geomicrobium sp. JCM 19038 TaxID=1460635 RepID=UPI00045F3183|nr:permease prefix domain 1-containing protein [Geomicrobium sp. JCM 19038]GAK08447.1 hypothetical protein JCM19038_2231 [Geomicrobium sp. JCM 19038]
MSSFPSFVARIVQQTDGSRAEHEDLYEELLTHLEDLKEDKMSNGKSEKEAEEEAMTEFGKESVLGDQIQQAKFPFRREMFLGFVFGSFLWMCALFVHIVVSEQMAVYSLFTIFIGQIAVLVISLNQRFVLRRKLWMNMALLVHLVLFILFGLTGLYTQAMSFHVLFYVLILFNIALIYLTTLSYNASSKEVRTRRYFHSVQLTTGFIIAAFNVTMSFGAMIFVGMNIILLNYALPIVVWALSYVLQAKFLQRTKRAMIISTVITLFVFLFGILPIASLWFEIVPTEIVRFFWPFRP